jgi:hypothetical protein
LQSAHTNPQKHNKRTGIIQKSNQISFLITKIKIS